MRAGSTNYHATLAIRADSGITRLEQLAERRAGWVDPWSAAGYLFPRRILRDAKIDPASVFAKQRFYSSHPAVLEALRAGEIDVAGTYLDRSGLLRPAGDDAANGLVSIGTSASIPSDALCVGPGANAKQLASIEAKLTSDRAAELASTLQADGFVTRPLADYAMVRALLDEEWGRTSSDPPG